MNSDEECLCKVVAILMMRLNESDIHLEEDDLKKLAAAYTGFELHVHTTKTGVRVYISSLDDDQPITWN